MNEHGYCPKCNADLDGGSIWMHFFNQTGSEQKATEIAENYGATKQHGQWNRAIAIYDIERDRTTDWQCPDCNHQWAR